MASLVRMASIGVVLVVCLGHGLAGFQSSQQRVTVEFRLAETAAGEGLTKASVPGTDEHVYLHKESLITNRDIVKAHVVEDPFMKDQMYSVHVEFTKEGAERMSKATQAHYAKPLAILVDGKVISAPIVFETISDRAAITGRMTKEEAERIAKGISSR